MQTVVCFGASLTAGTVSFDYLPLLRANPSLANYRFLNHGRDGDVAWSGLQRLDAVIAERPDYVSILIGTNDINATMSERNLLRYKEFYKVPVTPTIEWYEENLVAIVTRLKNETDARLALMSIALIGEDLEHEANRKVERYNEVVRRVARNEQTAYLPLYEKMVAYLHDHESDRAQLPPMLAYKDGLTLIGNATALHANGMSWDDISRRNGLLLLTDTLHLNSIGGGMIAHLIEGWLFEG